MFSTKKFFEMLNRINHTPSFSDKFRLDAKIVHHERINALLTKPDGKRVKIGKGRFF